MNDRGNTARIMNLADYNIGIKHNGELLISLGKSRFETAWKNKRILWSSLLARLSKSVETPETHAEYMKMLKGAAGPDQGHRRLRRRASGKRPEKDRQRPGPPDPHPRPGLPSC